MREHIENKQYGDRLRLVLQMYAALKRIKNLPARRMQYDNWRDEITAARKQLRRIGVTNGDVVIYDKHGDEYGEGYTVIYKDLYEFDGTKQQLVDYLWKTHATRITSPYDCTGQHFTTGYKVAHVVDNLWKVAESWGVDV